MNYLITGISKGLGLEICKLALQNGDIVYGISRTKPQDVLDLLEKYPKTFCHKVVNLLDDVDNLNNIIFKEFLNNSIKLDCLINNAAIAYDDIVTNLDLKKITKMFNVNVYSPMILTKGSIRNMLFNKTKGSIINISSISAHTGYKGLSMYAATKGALESFSLNVSREWGSKGIRSNCVVVGFMDTDMSKSLNEEQKNRIYKRTSLKQPTDIKSVAETILFLSSNKASSITGQNIIVDSGTI